MIGIRNWKNCIVYKIMNKDWPIQNSSKFLCRIKFTNRKQLIKQINFVIKQYLSELSSLFQQKIVTVNQIIQQNIISTPNKVAIDLLKQIQKFIYLQEFKQTLIKIDELLTIKNTVYVLQIKAKILIKLNQNQKALQIYKILIQKQPNNFNILLSLAYIYYITYKNQNCYLTLKKIKPINNLQYYVLYGNLYNRLKKYDEALSYFEKANKLNPRDNDINCMLAELYLKSSKKAYEKCLGKYNEILKQKKYQNWIVYNNKACIYAKMKKMNQAQFNFKLSKSLFVSKQVLINYSILLVKQKDFIAALKLFKQNLPNIAIDQQLFIHLLIISKFTQEIQINHIIQIYQSNFTTSNHIKILLLQFLFKVLKPQNINICHKIFGQIQKKQMDETEYELLCIKYDIWDCNYKNQKQKIIELMNSSKINKVQKAILCNFVGYIQNKQNNLKQAEKYYIQALNSKIDPKIKFNIAQNKYLQEQYKLAQSKINECLKQCKQQIPLKYLLLKCQILAMLRKKQQFEATLIQVKYYQNIQQKDRILINQFDKLSL